MSEELGTAAPATTPAEAVQPSTEGTQVPADGTGAPAQAAETDQERAERLVKEDKVRRERAQRNTRGFSCQVTVHPLEPWNCGITDYTNGDAGPRLWR